MGRKWGSASPPWAVARVVPGAGAGTGTGARVVRLEGEAEMGWKRRRVGGRG